MKIPREAAEHFGTEERLALVTDHYCVVKLKTAALWSRTSKRLSQANMVLLQRVALWRFALASVWNLLGLH